MIPALIDRFVSSFSVSRLIIVSLIARILALFLLPSIPSFLAPDEGTYASLAAWVAESKDADLFPDYGAGLYNTSRTLILPAAALVRIGADELTAVRIVSITCGLLSIYFFSRILFLVLRIGNLQALKSQLSQRLIFVLLILFAFLPSLFIWSILGLRESVSNATILASVFFLLRLREIEFAKSNLMQTILAILFPILTITLSFGARRQTAFVFVVFFCISLLIMSRRRNLVSLTSVLLVGSALGLFYSTSPASLTTTQYAWISLNQTVSQTQTTLRTEVKLNGVLYICNKETEGNRILAISGELVCNPIKLSKTMISLSEIAKQAPIQTLDTLEYKREGNRLDAQTALAKTTCVNYSQLSTKNIICNAKEFPYRIAAFLIRPLPIMDSGSLSNNLASIENLIWIILILGFVYFLKVSMQNRLNLEVVIPTTVFILLFSTLAALYEGNLGTAFRHKSTILWGLLLVISIGIDRNWRKFEEESQNRKPRHSSHKLDN